MQFYQLANIVEFFDVSIVIPFFKKVKDFKRILPANQSFFQRNGIEVIIVMDEESEENELIEFLDEYPYINWKVIINRKDHEWRNPCKVLNVGIRHASHKYILILDPEVELHTDIVYQLRYVLEHYPKSFATGRVLFADFDTKIDKDNLWKYPHRPYGSIMVKKIFLEEIGGYSEIYTLWGIEDDNIRKRLELAGYSKIDLLQAIAIHREDNSDEHLSRNKKSDAIPIDLLKDALYPKKIMVNDNNWGKDFNEIIFDWRVNKSCRVRDQLLNEMDDYQIMYPGSFSQHYKVIALIPTRNEKKYVPEVLFHLDKYCDGIILLDNGSDDNTYEEAVSDKLILKVKTKYKGYFDDIGNRNMLLKLGHLFKTEWFYFTDADEKFHEKFTDFATIIYTSLYNVIAFRMIHLWNSTNHYRKDIKEGSKGIMIRYRMFRNIGFMQILSKRDVHFRATPYEDNVFVSSILITNYGFMEESVRKHKYGSYKNLDYNRNKQGYDYEYLLDEKPILGEIDELKNGVTDSPNFNSAGTNS